MGSCIFEKEHIQYAKIYSWELLEITIIIFWHLCGRTCFKYYSLFTDHYISSTFCLGSALCP